MKNYNLRKKVVFLVTALLLFSGLAMLYISLHIPELPSVSELLKLIGAYISVSVLLGFIYRVSVRKYDDQKMEQNISNIIDNKINSIVENSVHYGLVGFKHSIDFPEILNSLNKGDVLWWLDTYEPIHTSWIHELENAIMNGASINILMMHPYSDLANFRSDELGEQFNRDQFRSELSSFKARLDTIVENTNSYDGSLQIVEYKDLPSAPIYIICKGEVPKIAYSSMFLTKPTSIKFPHFIWQSSQGNFIGELYEYVLTKWERNNI